MKPRTSSFAWLWWCGIIKTSSKIRNSCSCCFWCSSTQKENFRAFKIKISRAWGRNQEKFFFKTWIYYYRKWKTKFSWNWIKTDKNWANKTSSVLWEKEIKRHIWRLCWWLWWFYWRGYTIRWNRGQFWIREISLIVVLKHWYGSICYFAWYWRLRSYRRSWFT